MVKSLPMKLSILDNTDRRLTLDKVEKEHYLTTRRSGPYSQHLIFDATYQ